MAIRSSVVQFEQDGGDQAQHRVDVGEDLGDVAAAFAFRVPHLGELGAEHDLTNGCDQPGVRVQDDQRDPGQASRTPEVGVAVHQESCIEVLLDDLRVLVEQDRGASRLHG
jgi:hypothetical protein